MSKVNQDDVTSKSGHSNILSRRKWNVYKIGTYLGTREQCVRFAEECELVKTRKLCRIHKKPMAVDKSGNNTVGSFRCHTGPCKNKARVSRATGTWFENAKISLPKIFYLMYCYAHHFSHEEVQWDDPDEESTLSSATITDWYNYCREAVVLYQLDHQKAVGKIGGPGKIVQIDECKFGKRKYKGRKFEGHWILGMIEDGQDDLRLEVCSENVRSAEVLIPLIKKHVAEGSIICTDYWRAYEALPQHGYEHRQVNHLDLDNSFVAEDGTLVKRNESQWRAVKSFFYKDKQTGDFTDLIFEYKWRKSLKKQNMDPLMDLINVIKYTYKA